jgi:hypothetical protein
VRAIRAHFLLLLLVLTPVAASAVTLDQVTSLHKSGVTDAVILALIERDRTVFSIQPEDIPALQRDGLSEALIIAMLKSGKDADDAVRAESAYTQATIAAALAPAPEVLIVGHGPERPNTYHGDGFFVNSNPGPYFVPPYFGPTAGSYRWKSQAPYASRDDRLRTIPRGDRYAQPRELCYAQVTSSASRGASLPFVTECPPVMQPRRLR